MFFPPLLSSEFTEQIKRFLLQMTRQKLTPQLKTRFRAKHCSKFFVFSDQSSEFAEVRHIADFNDSLENSQGPYRMGAERYNHKALQLTIQRSKKFIKATKRLTDSCFPAFLETLQNVHAPKTRQNISNVLIDFLHFLTDIRSGGTRSQKTNQT